MRLRQHVIEDTTQSASKRFRKWAISSRLVLTCRQGCERFSARGIVFTMLKDILRWGVLGGVFALPVIIPFIVSASMFFPFITGKNFTFRIIVELIFAGWILLALLDSRYRPRFSWVLAALTLFVAVVGLADIFGTNVHKSIWSNFERMEGYLAILHLFAYFLVASAVLNTEKLWRAFWYVTLTTSVVVAFIGLRPILEQLPQVWPLPRIDATFGNAIYLAIYSMFHVFIAFILALKWRGIVWHQVILGLVALLHVIIMILTMTRGTVIGFIGGGILAAILVAIFERERVWIRRIALGGLAVLLVVVAGAFAIKDTEFGQTNQLASRFTQYDLSGGTIQARFMNWGMAWEGVKERPLLGWGQGNYEYVFSKYYNPDMYAEEPWFDRTHNIIFDWLVAAGFLGLISYLLIYTNLTNTTYCTHSRTEYGRRCSANLRRGTCVRPARSPRGTRTNRTSCGKYGTYSGGRAGNQTAHA
jgi:O-antigen ligase